MPDPALHCSALGEKVRCMNRGITPLAWAATFSLACSSGELNREAQRIALLQAAEAVEIDAPSAERLAMVERLEQLELSDAQLQQTQSVCARGHRMLLAGEQGPENAASAFREATGGAPEGILTAEQKAAVEQAIADAERDIEAARSALKECIEELDALELNRRRE